jgi:hypothetical protein
VPSLQLPFPVPRVGLPVPVAKDTVQSCTHVASVRVPAAHDVVSCPDSEYPASHAGTQLDPDASSVSPAHVPAAALSGFVSLGYVSAVHAFAAQVASVRVPAAHDVVSCPDSEYPASHAGTQLDPDASSVSPAHVPAAALSGFVSFGYVSAVHAFAAHVESVTSPAAEHDVSPRQRVPARALGRARCARGKRAVSTAAISGSQGGVARARGEGHGAVLHARRQRQSSRRARRRQLPRQRVSRVTRWNAARSRRELGEPRARSRGGVIRVCELGIRLRRARVRHASRQRQSSRRARRRQLPRQRVSRVTRWNAARSRRELGEPRARSRGGVIWVCELGIRLRRARVSPRKSPASEFPPRTTSSAAPTASIPRHTLERSSIPTRAR